MTIALAGLLTGIAFGAIYPREARNKEARAEQWAAHEGHDARIALSQPEDASRLPWQRKLATPGPGSPGLSALRSKVDKHMPKSQSVHTAVQFSLKIHDDDHITRFFPGVSGLDTEYYRCSP